MLTGRGNSHMPTSVEALKPVPSSQWISGLSKAERDALIAKVGLVQSWIDDFARVLGKWQAPKARITETEVCYARWPNFIGVPAQALLYADERLLRIAVAHEFGHFTRRWVSWLSRSEFAKIDEEIKADRAAMALTGASYAELEASIVEICKFQGDMEGLTLDEHLAFRRALHSFS